MELSPDSEALRGRVRLRAGLRYPSRLSPNFPEKTLSSAQFQTEILGNRAADVRQRRARAQVNASFRFLSINDQGGVLPRMVGAAIRGSTPPWSFMERKRKLALTW